MNSINTLLMENEIDELEAKTYTVMLNFKKNLTEGVMDNLPTDLVELFDELAKRFDAARRGLGLVNKLPPGEQRQENKRRVMGNLNRIRAGLDRLIKQTDSNNFALGHSINQRERASQTLTPGRTAMTPPVMQRDVASVMRESKENILKEGLKIIKQRHADYFKSPAEGICHCGNTVELKNSMDNECDKCHRNYNSSGQEVTPSWECDDQGNPLSDYHDEM